ncbi:MAG TPA: type II secretion system F family protein [Intrasporangium sp.]|uniref:type II secretion system F family protein n=1 Tax=Intrasporangium sp. TaxID=1925024 RepID=UPI002D78641B|nr:type II secretion system F family protein [Intrasporangium sp.]HET7398704.1 type II secretion system F family protein [Intrasporangium sp.]
MSAALQAVARQLSGASAGLLVALLVAAAVLLLPRRAGSVRPPATGSHGPPDGTLATAAAASDAADASARTVRRRAVPRRPVRRRGAPTPAGRGDRVSVDDVMAAMVLLALAYRSGLPTSAVLERVADQVPGHGGADLRQVSAAVLWGASEAEAWASVDDRWAPAAAAISLAHVAGLPPGPLLLRAADDARSAQLEQVEVAAARVGVRLVLPLGLVLLPAFCLTTVAPLVLALAVRIVTGR